MNETRLMADAAEAAAGADNLLSGVGSIVEWVKKAIGQVGCEHKEEIIAAADKAIDALVAVDMPQVPNALESILDTWIASYAKIMVRRAIERICGNQII